MISKENLLDRAEIEICLSNLIVLCDILDKNNSEYLTNLEKLNKSSVYIKNLNDFKNTYLELSEKMSLKIWRKFIFFFFLLKLKKKKKNYSKLEKLNFFFFFNFKKIK